VVHHPRQGQLLQCQADALAVGTDQTSGAKLDAAKVAGPHGNRAGEPPALQHGQHRSTSSPTRLAIVRRAYLSLWPLRESVCPGVVIRVGILRAHSCDEGLGLTGVPGWPHGSDEYRALDRVFGGGLAIRDAVARRSATDLCHRRGAASGEPSSPRSTSGCAEGGSRRILRANNR